MDACARGVGDGLGGPWFLRESRVPQNRGSWSSRSIARPGRDLDRSSALCPSWISPIFVFPLEHVRTGNANPNDVRPERRPARKACETRSPRTPKPREPGPGRRANPEAARTPKPCEPRSRANPEAVRTPKPREPHHARPLHVCACALRESQLRRLLRSSRSGEMSACVSRRSGRGAFNACDLCARRRAAGCGVR
jgi:hypothetical protein